MKESEFVKYETMEIEIYQGQGIRVKFDNNLITMLYEDYNYVEDREEWSECGCGEDDELNVLGCFCEQCTVHVSDITELRELIDYNVKTAPSNLFPDAIEDHNWDESQVVISKTQFKICMYKDANVYNNVIKDLATFEKYCEKNEINLVWW